jgi:putative flippase GtrA
MRSLIAQMARFGVVGAVGYIVDVGLFNLLLSTVFDPATMHSGPIWAKVISTTVAVVVNWIGNRLWTFGSERRTESRRHVLREGIEFAIVSLGGLFIGLGCLWVSHYALGYTSRLADNISANGVGLVLGTTFRFLLYRLWVFNPKRAARLDAAEAASPTAPTPTTAGPAAAAAQELGSAEAPVQPAS